MFPQRIVCLSAESADICAKPGVGDRIVGVSVFASRELRQARAVVSGFSTLKRGELMELSLDFSDHLLRCTGRDLCRADSQPLHHTRNEPTFTLGNWGR